MQHVHVAILSLSLSLVILQIVKEQKLRMNELLNNRQELARQLNDKTKQLETEIIARTKYEERFNGLQGVRECFFLLSNSSLFLSQGEQ